jgi:hypothetical protein
VRAAAWSWARELERFVGLGELVNWRYTFEPLGGRGVGWLQAPRLPRSGALRAPSKQQGGHGGASYQSDTLRQPAAPPRSLQPQTRILHSRHARPPYKAHPSALPPPSAQPSPTSYRSHTRRHGASYPAPSPAAIPRPAKHHSSLELHCCAPLTATRRLILSPRSKSPSSRRPSLCS